MSILPLVKERYAARHFSDRRVDEALVSELIEIIRFAPSSLNLQPWVLHVVTDAKIKEELSPAAYNQAQIATCSHLLVLCANTDVETLVTQLREAMTAEVGTEKTEQYLGYIVNNYVNKMDQEQRKVWAQKQVYIALAHAMLGAESLGFDACPMEGFVPSEVSRILALPDHLIPTVLCPIGYGDDVPRAKVRFGRELIIL